jgi:predicted secreted protein
MSEVVITVRGEHDARIMPERAVVHLSILADGPERGAVVERVAALTEPVRDDLIARREAGAVADWSSRNASVWSERPWGPDGRRLAPVHHASVDLTATFIDFAALSWWAGDVAEREGVQLGWIDWQLTPETRARKEREVATDAVQVAVDRAAAYAAALGLQTVNALEIADVGLLTHDGGREGGPQRMMVKAARGFAADSGGQGPALQFQPEEIVVASAVEARFAAR